MRPLILAVLIAVTLALPMPADAQCPPMTSTNVFIQFSNPSGTCTQAGGTCGVGETLTFTAQRYQYDFGCAAHTFSWNFGDGSATATGQGPVNHTYTSANTYTVQLTIANPSQTFVVSQAVRVGSCGTMRPGQNVFISYHDQNFNCTYLSGNCPAPATIYFAASSFGDYNFNCGTHTFNWTFGDGQTATGQTPTHTYVASGTYDIICNVSGPTGSVNLTAVVVVGPPDVVPTAAFTWLPASPIAGQPVTFSDASTGNPTSWLWEFGDGTSSNATNPIHTFSSAGTYNVELSVANRVGARHVAHLIAVLAAPVASFNWSPTRPAVRDAVQFVDTSSGVATAWMWTFGDGSQSNTQHPVHSFASAGTYSVGLTASNAVGSNATSHAIVVDPPDRAPSAEFDWTPAAPVAGNYVRFFDRSSGNPAAWSWNFGDGETSQERGPQHFYRSAGNYTVVLSASNELGADARSHTLVVTNAPPTPGQCPVLTQQDVYIAYHGTVTGCAPNLGSCVAGESIGFAAIYPSCGNPSFVWTFGDGTAASSQLSPQHSYSSAGTFSVTLIFSNGSSSIAVAQQIKVESTAGRHRPVRH